MSIKARSALGEIVDFDLLTIKDQLASRPTPVGVDKRRRFIDEKDGLRSRREQIQPESQVPDALSLAMQAVEQTGTQDAE